MAAASRAGGLFKGNFSVQFSISVWACAGVQTAPSSSSATPNKATPRDHARARREVLSRVLKLRPPELFEEKDKPAEHALEARPVDEAIIFDISWD
jgi:hypothetical protein